MLSDRDVRRLNLAVKRWSANCIGCLMKCTPEYLIEQFNLLSPEQIADLDEEIDRKPTIIVGKPQRDETRMPSDEGFWTPPRSSKSSGGESKGYRSTP